MGCGESKHAVSVATDNTTPPNKPSKENVNTLTNTTPEAANGIENAPNGEKKDVSNAAIIMDAIQAPEENADNVKEIVGANGELASQVENEGAVAAEGEDELKETNVDNQEAIAEKTSSQGEVADEKNGSTEETKEEDSTNQNNEESPKEENIPKAEETVAEESKEDSKAN